MYVLVEDGELRLLEVVIMFDKWIEELKRDFEWIDYLVMFFVFLFLLLFDVDDGMFDSILVKEEKEVSFVEYFVINLVCDMIMEIGYFVLFV